MSFWEQQRVMVTGGAGFLGSTVCRKLNERGAKDVFIPHKEQYDLTREADVKRVWDEVDPTLVIHLAARVGGIGANMAAPADLYVSNILMGTYVIEQARRSGTPKTVLLGTICAYPKHTPVPFSEKDLWNGYPEETNAPYGIAKKAMLVHAQANRDQYGQNCIYLLPTNLYGPGDKFNEKISHVVAALVKKCIEAKERGEDYIDVWGTGTATREFLYVDDAAEGILLASEHYDEAEPVNLGTNDETSIRDLVELIAKLTEFDGELRWDASKPDGQPRRRVDATLAREKFGFEAKMSLEEGLRRTIEWFLANRDVAEAVSE